MGALAFAQISETALVERVTCTATGSDTGDYTHAFSTTPELVLIHGLTGSTVSWEVHVVSSTIIGVSGSGAGTAVLTIFKVVSTLIGGYSV